MPSLLPGFEYDIFISYRQNDNRAGWVTEFVKVLHEELASTLKDPVSVYFDTNPHDGLLETHQVGKSLEGKLKCLIFIPVISQTYCDPRSFAWRHELCAFHEAAKRDQFGCDIKLQNGNVTHRILPIKIHDIDVGDKVLLENELGGVLRAVEFIFKSPGVNRPLKPQDDRIENLNHTLYIDQVNKVANAIKEIVLALSGQQIKSPVSTPEMNRPMTVDTAIKPRTQKILALTALAVLLVVLAGYMLVNFTSVGSRFYPEPLNKSIAVLPFDNLSSDPNQEYFSIGMMDEVLNHLYKIGALKVTSRTSAMAYKGTTKSMKQIAEELGVAYLLEGSVQKNENQIRIIVQLIDGKTDEHLWSETYDREVKDVFGIQSDVAQQVAAILKIKIDPDLKKRIEMRPTQNTEAYDLFLRSRSTFVGTEPVVLLEKAISLDPNFAEAYAELGLHWIYRGGFWGDLTPNEVLQKALPLIQKGLAIDPNLASGHIDLALISLYYKWDFDNVEVEYRKILHLYPSNVEVISWFNDFLLASQRFQESVDLSTRAFRDDKNSWMILALSEYFNNNLQRCLDLTEGARTAGLLETRGGVSWLNYVRINVYTGQFEKAILSYIDMKSTHNSTMLAVSQSPIAAGLMAVAYTKAHQPSSALPFLDTLVKRSKRSPIGSPSYFAAAAYSAMDKKELAVKYLEKAYHDHEVEMYWIKVEPLFRELHGEPRFQALVDKVFAPKKN